MSVKRISYSETSDLLEAILGGTPFGILAIDLRGDVTMINQQAREFFEVPFDLKEIPGKNIFECLRYVSPLEEVLSDCLKKDRKSFNFDSIRYQERFLAVKGRAIDDGFIITVQNITSLKEAEARALIAMIEGQENERKRISREIHDGIGPYLSAIRLNLEALQGEISDDVAKDTNDKLMNIINLLEEISKDLRNLSHALLPGVLQDYGLIPALESLCSNIRKANRVDIVFYSNMTIRLPENLELGLYRISQELINNALKHSDAKQINVQLLQHSGSVILTVEDNGKGFDPATTSTTSEGIGLKNVELRSRALGANLIVESNPGQGVMATVEIPYKH